MTSHIPRRLALGMALSLGTGLVQPAWAQASRGKPAEAKPIRVALIESLSGPFANTGEAVYRNLLWATERVNARGGVKLPGGARRLQIVRFDSKGQVEEALAAMQGAADAGIEYIAQGNSSAIAAALIQAVDKHNRRDPKHRMLFLNYSAVEPSFTNEGCSFWHFRFDAHSDMRLAALMQVMEQDQELKQVYLIGQDYSFGQAVLRQAQAELAKRRPDVQVVGNELHPVGRVKDFLPYANKIVASGAQAVVTGNWGNDLTLLVRAARDAGYKGRFYTFYGNALGAPAAIGDAGIGKVVAVADWLPNMPDHGSRVFYRAFRDRFPRPEDDYVHMRMQLLIEALAQSIERARRTEAGAVAYAMETAKVSLAGRSGAMRAADHQFQQPIVVGVMDKLGAPGVTVDVEGSGYGFRVVKELSPDEASMPTTCRMVRPPR
ncbi:branched-chain amino acid ABC transporter substrate-binding protein [Comamonas serinivorans]|uniref:Branched-chain amino acid ABC transporter substrate-binding protein n=1 Tax=Comamonas serinivorans TaxID=1082851 RepID=A0A1Y0EST6_9BURK|nr:branched-chain amino acid ABC transporter substrate-binding protein [Comamonas serinivorans]ARU06734.1 branched-chain amino acid ABC transporter substrate-binding protein [Comamonas serinivorans]